ncbi:hypothetical protein DFH28DRAFT_1136543 [Melampsora americana]|nr:hypothetical protein DFH28DRAFT_1136543 [Melampsora americana]
METRRRNYRENPRSPAKRRRTRRTKQTLIKETQASIFDYHFPSPSDLPPLPESPVSEHTAHPILELPISPVFPDLYSLPPLPPSPISNPNSIVESSTPPRRHLPEYLPTIDAYIQNTEYTATNPDDNIPDVESPLLVDIPTPDSHRSTDTIVNNLHLYR